MIELVDVRLDHPRGGEPLVRDANLKVSRGENVVLEVPLQAAESVTTGGITRRAFDAVTELVIGLFRSGNKRI